MAVNLNKQVNLKTIKGLFSKKDGLSGDDLPSKTTMNMYQPLARNGAKSPTTLILLGVLGALVLVAFIKFGVLDQFARVNAARASLEQTQARLSEIESQLVGVDAMEEEYAKYSNNYLNAAVTDDDVLSLTETYVKPYATVSAINLSQGVLTYSLSNTTLDVVGDIASSVNGYPLVESVSVSTAKSDGKTDVSQVTAEMTVVFVSEHPDQKTEDYKQSDLFSGLDTNGHDVLANTRG
jgi:hypothetical protein